MAKRPSKKKVIQAVEKAWGPGIQDMAPTLGFFEGNPAEAAESVLHELCHAFSLDLQPMYSDCVGLNKHLGALLRALHPVIGDVNEIRTIAAELLVIEALGLRLSRYALLRAGYVNLRAIGYRNLAGTTGAVSATHAQFAHLVATAERSKKAKRIAAQVLRFIYLGGGETMKAQRSTLSDNERKRARRAEFNARKYLRGQARRELLCLEDGTVWAVSDQGSWVALKPVTP